jgi:E2F/DP family winged-helix DNA-binding domain
MAHYRGGSASSIPDHVHDPAAFRYERMGMYQAHPSPSGQRSSGPATETGATSMVTPTPKKMRLDEEEKRLHAAHFGYPYAYPTSARMHPSFPPGPPSRSFRMNASPLLASGMLPSEHYHTRPPPFRFRALNEEDYVDLPAVPPSRPSPEAVKPETRTKATKKADAAASQRAAGNTDSTKYDPNSYSRKSKSLGVLATAVCVLYQNGPLLADVVVDHLAKELMVERRRIYDIVNIFESIRLVAKKGKNTYSWLGRDHTQNMLAILQHQAILEDPTDAIANGVISRDELRMMTARSSSDHASSTQADKPGTAPPTTAHGKVGSNAVSRPGLEAPQNAMWTLDVRKESRSLLKLSQNFLQLFLLGNECVSLPDASDKIQGATKGNEEDDDDGDLDESSSRRGKRSSDGKQQASKSSCQAKTKIRRLYDIANVFVALGMVQKLEDKYVDSEKFPRRSCFYWTYPIKASEFPRVYLELSDYQKLTQCPFGPSNWTVKPSLSAPPSRRGSTETANSEIGSSARRPVLKARVDLEQPQRDDEAKLSQPADETTADMKTPAPESESLTGAPFPPTEASDGDDNDEAPGSSPPLSSTPPRVVSEGSDTIGEPSPRIVPEGAFDTPLAVEPRRVSLQGHSAARPPSPLSPVAARETNVDHEKQVASISPDTTSVRDQTNLAV